MASLKKRENKKVAGIAPMPYQSFFFGEDFTEKPCFCLQYLHPRYNVAHCSDEQKIALISTLERLSSIKWIDIEASQRHGLGSEKIARDAIRPDIPASVPRAVTFLAIRFAGLAPMIGFRERNIFHIVFLDSQFNVYAH